MTRRCLTRSPLNWHQTVYLLVVGVALTAAALGTEARIAGA
jgi:hypothetical protein